MNLSPNRWSSCSFSNAYMASGADSSRGSRAHTSDHRTGPSETPGFKYPQGRTATARDPCSNPPLRGTRAAVAASTASASLALSEFFRSSPEIFASGSFHSVSFSRPVGSCSFMRFLSACVILHEDGLILPPFLIRLLKSLGSICVGAVLITDVF